jgi:hypothetical protein
MKSSKTHDAKPGPACGRAVTGMLLIETSTAGNLRRDGSSTARPVSGLISDGKSSASGPYVIGKRWGWGEDVPVGMDVAVEVDVLDAMGMVVSVIKTETAGELLHAAKIRRKLNRSVLRNIKIL